MGVSIVIRFDLAEYLEDFMFNKLSQVNIKYMSL